MIYGSRRTTNAVSAWPGYVDVLSALLMVVIFILMIFTVAQFFLNQVLFGQKNELAHLHAQVSELTELLGLEKEKSVALDTRLSELSDTIVALSEDREVLSDQVAGLETQTKEAKEEVRLKMLTIASLNEDIQALRQVREALEEKVAAQAAALSESAEELGALRDRSKKLVARLAEKEEMTVLAQEKIKEQDIRIQALSVVLASQKEAIEAQTKLSADARAQVALLSEQIERLREQLNQISTALALSKKQGEQKDETIRDLGKQLNIALARKVHDLEKYRSEFFGRLKQILGDNPAVEIRGDRFVIQAGLLFESGSAGLGDQGRQSLKELALTLAEISRKIPGDMDWILRIDGHTDKIPIHTPAFASNWELSTARAVSVVRFLIEMGIPEERLAATGFSKYHPLETADTPEAYRRNRRIEIKLTSS